MKKLKDIVESIQLVFARLTQREQVMVLGGGAVGVVVLCMIVGGSISQAVTRSERRLEVKSEQLLEILELEGEYRVREREKKERMIRLSRSKIRLVSVVEEAAKQAEVSIGQLRPDEGEPNSDGIVESRVDLRVSDLSIDRLEAFLNNLEQSSGLVYVRRLKVDRPYRKDALNVEMTVTTYKVKL